MRNMNSDVHPGKLQKMTMIPVRDGVFHCGIWGIHGYSTAGYGVFHCRIWDMRLIGSDIEYIELEDIHSYLDEIFPKLNTP